MHIPLKWFGWGAVATLLLAVGIWVGTNTQVKPVKLSERVARSQAKLLQPTVPKPNPDSPEARTRCYLQCADLPYFGFKCVMVCITCFEEWGGGCDITIFPPN